MECQKIEDDKDRRTKTKRLAPWERVKRDRFTLYDSNGDIICGRMFST